MRNLAYWKGLLLDLRKTVWAFEKAADNPAMLKEYKYALRFVQRKIEILERKMK